MAAKPPSAAQFRILALPLARLPRPVRPSNPANSAAPSPALGSTSTAAQPTSDPTATQLPASGVPSGTPDTPVKSPNPLILFHVSQPPAPSPSVAPEGQSKYSLSFLSNRALNTASDQWLKLGNKPKTTWSYWFYSKGEGLMDRIEYEEWALKGIQEGLGVRIAKEGETQKKIEIPLLHPKLQGQALPPLIPKLHRLLIHRIPYHKKMMTRTLIASPLTWPFAIIPVMPNFPLFYVLWRAWSHYKAWKGAVYLEQLLKLGMIVERPSKELDEVYSAKGVVVGQVGEEDHAPDETTSKGVKLGSRGSSPAKAVKAATSATEITSKSRDAEGIEKQAKGELEGAPDGTTTPESMVYHGSASPGNSSKSSKSAAKRLHHPSLLLTPNQVPLLAKTFGLRQLEVIDVNRAVEQADMRAKKLDEGWEEREAAKQQAASLKEGQWRGNLHR